MYDNYNYPAGADTPDAPWNQREQMEVGFSCDVEVTLHKQMHILTSDYIADEDETGVDYDTSGVDWEAEYKDRHIQLTQLLAELAKYIKGELTGDMSAARRRYLNKILGECEGWTINYLNIEQ